MAKEIAVKNTNRPSAVLAVFKWTVSNIVNKKVMQLPPSSKSTTFLHFAKLKLCCLNNSFFLLSLVSSTQHSMSCLCNLMTTCDLWALAIKQYWSFGHAMCKHFLLLKAHLYFIPNTCFPFCWCGIKLWVDGIFWLLWITLPQPGLLCTYCSGLHFHFFWVDTQKRY